MNRVALGALFEPEGIVVAGASAHPGKFGFTSLHNILAGGYDGRVFATNLEGGTVLGVETVGSILELPEGAADLVFVCTPPQAVPSVLENAAARGVKAAFVTTAGYREAGPAGRRDEDELVALAERLGLLLAGPNGQGIVSSPSQLCAQIVAPMPPAGRIGVASQSGNLVSGFLNLARHTGIGVSRAISAGNSAMLGVTDYLAWYADDDATAVSLTYLEGVEDGEAFYEAMAAIGLRKPVVLVKGGATELGATAAASHTGSLASDDRVIDGILRQTGVVRAHTIEGAFDMAATFATQPLPRGPRVMVVTTVGGWGVLTADAVAASSLELLPLPSDLEAAISDLVPPRWSRNNPIDLAGGETRDTVPEALRLVAEHVDVDAVIFIGIGIQSNTARGLREGPFHPDHGTDRVAEFHRRQDRRYAEAAVEASEASDKPVLVVSELGTADPDNPGPATLRELGRLCYPSAQRAVEALERAWWFARHRARRAAQPT